MGSSFALYIEALQGSNVVIFSWKSVWCSK